MKENKYVVVTCVSTHRIRYCVSVDDLQKMNTDTPIDGHEREWAMDSVTCEEIKEFSQEHIGESIVDSKMLNESQMLELFDEDNDYLKEWTKEQKIKWVRANIKTSNEER